MSYQVTARKWRPQIFDEVVGQQHITQTLKNAILNERIAHAYIFAGPRGVGKTTTARILAKSLNCLAPVEAEPCNKCEMCNSFNTSQSMDIIEIDGASNRRIEDIRSLRESVKYAPTSGSYKIYIIDEVHMLTTESFNALLKTLEEPPEHTIFIFATTDIHKVPLTIISRCQRFDFRRIELNNIKELLSKIAEAEGITIDDQSLTLIGKKADGALRDAESLFDQVVSFCDKNIESEILTKMLNMIDDSIYFQISDAIIEKDFALAFNVSKRIYDNGWNFIDFINGLIEHFRNILSVIVTKNNSLIESSEANKEKYLSYSTSFSEGDMLRILSFLNKTIYEIRQTQNQRLKVEVAIAHLIGFEKSATISDLINKIGSGEEINIAAPQKKAPEPEVKKKIVKIEKTPVEKPVIKVPEPEQKTLEVKEPEPEQKFTQKAKVDFSFLKEIWNEFVKKVTEEKFTIGILTDCKIESFENNRVTLNCNNRSDKDILNSQVKFLKEKFDDYYNSLIEFNFVLPEIKSETAAAVNGFSDDEKSPLEQAIISELGGRKL